MLAVPHKIITHAPHLSEPPVRNDLPAPPENNPSVISNAVSFMLKLAGFPNGPKLWEELHLRALSHDGSDDTAWLVAFEKRILGNCICRKYWTQDVAINPPDFANYFEWTVAQHNTVNGRLEKPILTVEEARKIWSAMPSSTHKDHISSS